MGFEALGQLVLAVHRRPALRHRHGPADGPLLLPHRLPALSHVPLQLPSSRRAHARSERPRILLLDEPFGALDPGIRADMHGLITRLWRDYSLTVVMVTHDIKEAFTLGTRVLALDKRRHDPHAPHRYGATAVYDLPLRGPPVPAPEPETQPTPVAATN